MTNLTPSSDTDSSRRPGPEFRKDPCHPGRRRSPVGPVKLNHECRMDSSHRLLPCRHFPLFQEHRARLARQSHRVHRGHLEQSDTGHWKKFAIDSPCAPCSPASPGAPRVALTPSLPGGPRTPLYPLAPRKPTSPCAHLIIYSLMFASHQARACQAVHAFQALRPRPSCLASRAHRACPCSQRALALPGGR